MDREDPLNDSTSSDRREFVGQALRVIVLSPILPLAAGSVSGCVSVNRLLYRPKVRQGKLRVPARHLAQLKNKMTVIVIRARGLKEPIMLRRVNGQLLALSGICTHRACAIDPTPYNYECPCHGSTYSLTGVVQSGPAERSLKRFAITPTDDGIAISLQQ